MKRYRGKYRIDSTRLQGWEYTSAGWYFVTICTKDQTHFFGGIVGVKANLSPIGEIAAQEWLRTSKIRNNAALDEWILMPNHIHGIIILRNAGETPRRGISTQKSWEPNSLGSIINQYKSICTKRIRAEGFLEFAWQPSYHDHIIRNDKALDRIRRYIRENPIKWHLDQYHPDNL